MTPTKFTKEIKENWLKALKSGQYKQGFYGLYRAGDNSYCCIGVLGACTPGLSVDNTSPYVFLEHTIGRELSAKLFTENDRITETAYAGMVPRDYSNVIPLIESLPTQD